MGEYNEKLCKEHCKNVDEKLDVHDKRLNNHADRIDKLEQRGARVDEKIENLCDQIKNLISTLKWGFGIIVTIALFVLGYLIKIK